MGIFLFLLAALEVPAIARRKHLAIPSKLDEGPGKKRKRSGAKTWKEETNDEETKTCAALHRTEADLFDPLVERGITEWIILTYRRIRAALKQEEVADPAKIFKQREGRRGALFGDAIRLGSADMEGVADMKAEENLAETIKAGMEDGDTTAANAELAKDVLNEYAWKLKYYDFEHVLNEAYETWTHFCRTAREWAFFGRSFFARVFYYMCFEKCLSNRPPKIAREFGMISAGGGKKQQQLFWDRVERTMEDQAAMVDDAEAAAMKTRDEKARKKRKAPMGVDPKSEQNKKLRWKISDVQSDVLFVLLCVRIKQVFWFFIWVHCFSIFATCLIVFLFPLKLLHYLTVDLLIFKLWAHLGTGAG